MAELLKVREITIDTMQYKDFATKEEELKVMRFYQNDLNSAKLLINVTHDKVVTDFSTATKVQIAFLKPDGKRVFQDVQNVNQMQGKYYVVLSTQTLIAYGNVIAQLRLTFPNNKVIETCKFVFAVDESIMSDEAMESTNEFPVIQKAIEAGEKLEGVDIDGIIAAGAKADAALPKTGGTMTGHLRLDVGTGRRLAFSDGASDLYGFVADKVNLNLFDWKNNSPIMIYSGVNKTLTVSAATNFTGDLNVYKKTDIYGAYTRSNGASNDINDMDLNTIIESGLYSGQRLLNSPEGATSTSTFYYVEVVKHRTTGFVKQVASLLASTTQRIWIRTMNNGTWGAWTEVTTRSKDGQVTLTLTSDITNANSGYMPLAERRGNTVTMRMEVTRNVGSASSLACTLPVDMRPPITLSFTCLANDGTPVGVNISWNGSVDIYTAGKQVKIAITYAVV